MFSGIRRRLVPSSVRTRLTFWYLLTLAAVLLAFAASVFAIRTQALQREIDADLEVRALRLVSDLRPALLSLDLARALSGSEQAASAALAVRTGPAGLLFRSPRFPELATTGERAMVASARDGGGLITVQDLAGETVRIVTVSLARPGAEPVIMHVAATAPQVRSVLGPFALMMVAAVVIVLGVASYGSHVTARRALAPVDQIVERVKMLQASQLGDRLDVHPDTEELDRLVRMLNEMLDRIHASVRTARRFAADASHELQTPVAAMRAAVESCLRGDDQLEDYRSMAIDLLGSLDRLSALVRDLKTLALADAGIISESREVVDLGGVAMECAEIARALAEERGIDVDTTVTGTVRVVGSATQLRRVILNLAQNAIRYSADGARVAIRVGLDGRRAVVRVEDEGSGIGPDDLPHIFEPFYRADPARARDTGGTGLGLAIADQIVRSWGGDIEVLSVVGHGSTFIVRLPEAPERVAGAPTDRVERAKTPAHPSDA